MFSVLCLFLAFSSVASIAYADDVTVHVEGSRLMIEGGPRNDNLQVVENRDRIYVIPGDGTTLNGQNRHLQYSIGTGTKNPLTRIEIDLGGGKNEVEMRDVRGFKYIEVLTQGVGDTIQLEDCFAEVECYVEIMGMGTITADNVTAGSMSLVAPIVKGRKLSGHLAQLIGLDLSATDCSTTFSVGTEIDPDEFPDWAIAWFESSYRIRMEDIVSPRIRVKARLEFWEHTDIDLRNIFGEEFDVFCGDATENVVMDSIYGDSISVSVDDSTDTESVELKNSVFDTAIIRFDESIAKATIENCQIGTLTIDADEADGSTIHVDRSNLSLIHI